MEKQNPTYKWEEETKLNQTHTGLMAVQIEEIELNPISICFLEISVSFISFLFKVE